MRLMLPPLKCQHEGEIPIFLVSPKQSATEHVGKRGARAALSSRAQFQPLLGLSYLQPSVPTLPYYWGTTAIGMRWSGDRSESRHSNGAGGEIWKKPRTFLKPQRIKRGTGKPVLAKSPHRALGNREVPGELRP